MPKNMQETIQFYLSDTRTNSIATVLNSVSEKLEMNLLPSDSLKSILHVVKNLTLLTNSNPEEQFLRSIITMMLDFQNKDHHSIKSHIRKRTADDSSKWLRTLLAISEKSDLTKLIDLLADRLHLTGNIVIGEVRNMDLTELFFLFEDIAIQSDFYLPDQSNKNLLLDINALMLTTLVGQKIPTAFFDVVFSQQNNPEHAILPAIQRQYQKPLVIEHFFDSADFFHYFHESSVKKQTSQQAFLMSFVNYLHAVIHKQYEKPDNNVQIIFQFLESSRKYRAKMNQHEFIQWFENSISEHNIDNHLQDFLLKAIEHEAELNSNRIGSLVFIANKLVCMGFSPKAASIADAGSFQPLITPHTPQTDIKNISALKLFLTNLKPDQQKQLIVELLFSALVQPHKTLTKLVETQSKISLKRPVDNHYPIPTLHHIKITKTARPTRIVRKKSTFIISAPASKAKFTKNPVAHAPFVLS
ncbi:MAG: hypothetical protein Q8R83_03605 [Legionellaceae bacterium]|nr:hypothetical protein [Legionellaceae bacterium]